MVQDPNQIINRAGFTHDSVLMQREQRGVETGPSLAGLLIFSQLVEQLGSIQENHYEVQIGGSPKSVVQLANKSASVRGEAVAAVVLLDGGAVAVQVIIIKMNNTNGDTATAKKNLQRSNDAANFTKEELVTRS